MGRVPIDEPPRLKKEPLSERAAATVDAILEAAAELLVQLGYARMTTNAVARRAGVSVGSLYQYFGNKHAIVAEIARRAEARAYAAARSLGDAEVEGAQQTCEAWVDLIVDPRLGSRDLRRALLLEIPELWISEARRDVAGGVERLLADSMANLTLRPGDPALMAFIAYHAISGVVQAVLRQRPEDFDSPALRRELRQLAWRYIAPDASDLTPSATRPEQPSPRPSAARLEGSVKRPRPKTKPARETVDRIVDATAEVLQEQGFDGLGARTIAKRAGLSPGALYRHFSNVPSILAELARRNDERNVHKTAAAIERARSAPLREAIHTIVSALCAPSHTDPDVQRALLVHVPRRWFLGSRAETSDDVQVALRQVFERRLGELRDADLTTAGFVAAHAVSATIEAALISGEDLRPEALVEELTELIHRYLRA